MSRTVPNPPPGFDDLPVDEQIDYVQALWERIAATPEQVPVPEWHRRMIRARLDAYRAEPAEGRSWEEVRAEIERRLGGRSSD